MIDRYAFMLGYLDKTAASFGNSPGLGLTGTTKDRAKGLSVSGAGKSAGSKKSSSIKGALTKNTQIFPATTPGELKATYTDRSRKLATNTAAPSNVQPMYAATTPGELNAAKATRSQRIGTQEPVPKAPQTAPADQFGNPKAMQTASSAPNQAVQPSTIIEAPNGAPLASSENTQQEPVNPAVTVKAVGSDSAPPAANAAAITNIAAGRETALANNINQATSPVTGNTFDMDKRSTVTQPQAIRPV